MLKDTANEVLKAVSYFLFKPNRIAICGTILGRLFSLKFSLFMYIFSIKIFFQFLFVLMLVFTLNQINNLVFDNELYA